MEDKWDYSVMREMQNRIRILEMDQHLIKSQILSTNHEVRNAFIEFAEKMDRMERKLIQMFNPDRSFRMESSYPPFSSVDHRFSQFSDSTEFDAMAYVETVMHNMEQQQQHAMQTNESKIMLQQQQGLNKRLKAKRRTVLQLATTSNSRQIPPHVSPVEPEPATDNNNSNSNNQSETGEGDIGKAMYECNFCEKSFKQSSGLSRHHKIHMRNKGYTVINVEEQDVDSPTYDKKNRPKKFFCDYEGCAASFISRSGMTKHLKNVHPTPLIPSTPPKLQPFLPRVPTNPRSQQQQSNMRNNNNNNGSSSASTHNHKIVMNNNNHGGNSNHVKVEDDADGSEEFITSAELTPNKDDIDDIYDDNDNISQMSVTDYDDDDEEDKFGNDSDSPRDSRISTPVSTP